MTGETYRSGAAAPLAAVAAMRITSPAFTCTVPLSDFRQLTKSSFLVCAVEMSAVHSVSPFLVSASVTVPEALALRRCGSLSRPSVTFTVPAFGAFHTMAVPPAAPGSSTNRP